MTLYYEDVPADDNDVPQLPPLLTAVAVASSHDVHAKAIALAASSEVGTVFYSEAVDRMHIAVVLSPEVVVADAGQMFFAMMIAAGDSIGALAPPEIAVSYQMPGYILLNKGRAGVVRVALDPAANSSSVPEWMVVSAEIMLASHDIGEEAWQQSSGYEHTSLAEEGGGHISRTRLVESCSRHFLVWINRWQYDGFRPLYDAWMHRLDTESKIIVKVASRAEWIGLDETGGTLVKLDGKPIAIPPHELETVCGTPALLKSQA